MNLAPPKVYLASPIFKKTSNLPFLFFSPSSFSFSYSSYAPFRSFFSSSRSTSCFPVLLFFSNSNLLLAFIKGSSAEVPLLLQLSTPSKFQCFLFTLWTCFQNDFFCFRNGRLGNHFPEYLFWKQNRSRKLVLKCTCSFQNDHSKK